MSCCTAAELDRVFFPKLPQLFTTAHIEIFCAALSPCVGQVAQSLQRLVTGWMVRGSNSGGGARFSAPVQAGRPLLWSSGQSFWLQIQRSRVRFPAPADFLSSSGSGTGSTQPPEVN